MAKIIVCARRRTRRKTSSALNKASMLEYVTFLDSNASRVHIRVKVLCVVRPIAFEDSIGWCSIPLVNLDIDPFLPSSAQLRMRREMSDIFLSASFVLLVPQLFFQVGKDPK